MPRKTYNTSKPEHPSLHEDLRTLRLAIQVRSEQVKLRRLEWDTQKIALPHITPLPGDGELQIRTPMTKEDIPSSLPLMDRPRFTPDMQRGEYKTMLDTYVTMVRYNLDLDPYQKLSSISAQEKRDARAG